MRDSLCRSLRHAVALGLCGLLLATPVAAQTAPGQGAGIALAEPEGDVILTVRGGIGRTNGAAEAQLDRKMIEDVGVVTVHTGTIWTEGTKEFVGVELAQLLAHLEAEGSMLRLTALNDYAVEIPLAEVTMGGPVLAFRMDGVDLSARDKGPLWMIYPYDQKPEFKTDVNYARSIWQVTTIEVLP